MACSNHYYRLDNDHPLIKNILNPLLLEDKFQKQENTLGQLSVRLTKNNPVFTFGEFEELMFTYIGFKVRNHHHRKSYSINFPKVWEEYLNEDKPFLEDYLNRDLSDVFNRVRTTFSRKDSEKALHLTGLLRFFEGEGLASNVPKFLNQRKAILFRSRDPLFITNDNPGFFVDKNDHFHNTKIKDFHSYVMPITPYELLVITPDLIPPSNCRIIDVKNDFDHKLIDVNNRAAMYLCNDSVYSCSRSVLEDLDKQYIDKVREIKSDP